MEKKSYSAVYAAAAYFAALCLILAVYVFELVALDRRITGAALLVVSIAALFHIRLLSERGKARIQAPDLKNTAVMLCAAAAVSALSAAPAFVEFFDQIGAKAVPAYLIMRPISAVFMAAAAVFCLIYVKKSRRAVLGTGLLLLLIALFLNVIAENSYIMALPNISIFLCRLFAFFALAMCLVQFCYSLSRDERAAGKSTNRNIFAYSLLGAVFCFADVFLWLTYRENPYFMPTPQQLVFSLTFGAAMLLTALAQINKEPAEAVTDEV